MADAAKDQADYQATLLKTQSDLADAESKHGDKEVEMKATEADKGSIANYLAKIKPGCDFIATNFVAREGHRDSESKALASSKKALMETPWYIATHEMDGDHDKAYEQQIGQYLNKTF